MERERQAGIGALVGALAATQQQEAGAVARHIVDRVGQHLEAVLGGRLQRGDGAPEAAAPHQPGRFSGGAGGQLQGLGKVLAQPQAALGQGLGVGEHLTDGVEGAAAHQGVADGQHQGPGHRQVGVLPEGIETTGDAPLDRVLHRHHRQIAVAVGQGPDHGADALLGHKVHRLEALEGRQSLRRLLTVGADGTEKGKTHGGGTLWGDR